MAAFGNLICYLNFSKLLLLRDLYPDLLPFWCPSGKVTCFRFVIRQNRFYRFDFVVLNCLIKYLTLVRNCRFIITSLLFKLSSKYTLVEDIHMIMNKEVFH